MDFGYFTLSDNYYPHNPRSASDFVLEIREQAILTARDTSVKSTAVREPDEDRKKS